MENQVDIIVVTFNRLSYIKNYIAMVHLSTDHPFRIFVVDNGSTDGTREFLLKMEKIGLISGHLFTEENLPLASAYSACFNKFYDILGDLVMTSADDHTPPLFFVYDWMKLLVEKINSDRTIGTINFRAARLPYRVIEKRHRPMLEERIRREGKKVDLLKKIKEHIYDEG